MFPKPINHLSTRGFPLARGDASSELRTPLTSDSVVRGQDAVWQRASAMRDPAPKTAKIFLNSQDRMFGTNNEATFKVNIPCDFTSSNVAVSLTNFIPTYP
jgi:hypothetical protein